MPPFRIAAHHPDRGHKDYAWAQVGDLYDDAADALEMIQRAADQDPELATVDPRSTDPERRERPGPDGRIAELVALGYEFKVQDLVPKTLGEDDTGAEIVVEHRWKDVD